MNKTIGNNLKKLRSVSAYTQDEIASALGITRSTYSNYESGERDLQEIGQFKDIVKSYLKMDQLAAAQ